MAENQHDNDDYLCHSHSQMLVDQVTVSAKATTIVTKLVGKRQIG
jgi:hypothetical protein